MGDIEATTFKPPKDNIAGRRDALNKVWSEAKDDDVWRNYLRSRGINEMTLDRVTDIRGTKHLSFFTDKPTKTVQYPPAMVALIRNSNGEPASIHRTYLFDDGSKEKKIMPTVSGISGGYIQLAPVEEQVILAEGIETALSAMCATGIPAWATISAHNLKAFDSVPERVSQVFICADHDKTFVGQAAAFACAERMKVKRHKKVVQVLMPKTQGWDMNDWFVNSGDDRLGLHTWWS